MRPLTRFKARLASSLFSLISKNDLGMLRPGCLGRRAPGIASAHRPSLTKYFLQRPWDFHDRESGVDFGVGLLGFLGDELFLAPFDDDLDLEIKLDIDDPF